MNLSYRYLYILLFCFVFSGLSLAQKSKTSVSKVKMKTGNSTGHHSTHYTFYKGTALIQAGVGLGILRSNFDFKPQIPPIMLAGEYGVSDKIGIGHFGIGVFTGISSYVYRGNLPAVNAQWKWRGIFIPVGARLLYHIPTIDHLDIYGGLWAGFAYRALFLTGNNNNANSGINSGLSLGLVLGGKYYLNRNTALLLELGTGFSLVQFGLAYKF